MKSFFRYDYKYKLFIISNLVSFIFFCFSIMTFNKSKGAFCILIFIVIFNLLITFLYTNRLGISIKDNKITIVYFSFFNSFNLSNVEFVEIKELKKEKKTNLYGFFHEFYHLSTYMIKCEYVYNNGKVFNIIFHLKDGSTKETYFGWMYKEKNIKIVNNVSLKLKTFIDNINEICKKNKRT